MPTSGSDIKQTYPGVSAEYSRSMENVKVGLGKTTLWPGGLQ